MSEVKPWPMEVCSECGHGITLHFESVSGHVRCLYKTSGVTTGGVPGMHYEESCDCLDYNSNNKAERELRQKRKP